MFVFLEVKITHLSNLLKKSSLFFSRRAEGVNWSLFSILFLIALSGRLNGIPPSEEGTIFSEIFTRRGFDGWRCENENGINSSCLQLSSPLPLPSLLLQVQYLQLSIWEDERSKLNRLEGTNEVFTNTLLGTHNFLVDLGVGILSGVVGDRVGNVTGSSSFVSSSPIKALLSLSFAVSSEMHSIIRSLISRAEIMHIPSFYSYSISTHTSFLQFDTQWRVRSYAQHNWNDHYFNCYLFSSI